MSEGDVTRRVTITANGEGIDSTTESVNKLGDAIGNTRDKADGGISLAATATAIAGIGAAAIAAYQGMKAFVDFTGKQAKSLADIAEEAETASMSTREFQQTMFAAMSQGVKESSFVTGLETINTQLQKASQGSTEFSRLLEKNGMSIRDKLTGELITSKVALDDIMKLANNATPQVATRIAQIVGVTKDWLPFLKQSSEEFENQKSKAADLGLIIDEGTIKKAKEFEKEWHTATAAWDLQLKASLGSIMPMMIQLAKIAIEVVNGIGEFGTDVSRLFTPHEEMGPRQLVNEMESLVKVREQLSSGQAPPMGIEKMLGLPNNATIKDIDKLLDKLADFYDKKSKIVIQTDSGGDKTTQLPDNDSGGKDALQRAIDQMERRAAITKADAEAAGLSAAAHAGLRAEAELYAAAERAGIKDLENYAEKFHDLGEEIKKSTAAMSDAKLASEINRGTQLRFASPEDVKIANQLKEKFGDDIPAALASSEAAALRFNDAMKSINDTTRQTVTAFANDLVQGLMKGTSLMDSLHSAAKNMATTLTSKAITDLFSGNWLQAGIEGIGAVGAYLFGNSGGDSFQKREQASWQKAYDEQQSRVTDYKAEGQLALVDQSTVSGQLQAFDLRAAKARADEAAKGNGAVLELEQDLANQRKAIVDKANQAIQKSLTDFLNSIKTGSLSTLSPEDQLKYAKDQFGSDYKLAQTGDEGAIGRITKDAQSLLEIAKSFYASGSGYASIYDSVTKSITQLAGSGGLVGSGATQATFSAFDSGGYVSNGVRGVDSVMAKLGGGEYVTRTESVNAQTLPALSFINRTGRLPQQSGGGDDERIVGVLVQGFNGQTSAILEALSTLTDRVKKVEEATRQGQSQRRLPGTKAA